MQFFGVFQKRMVAPEIFTLVGVLRTDGITIVLQMPILLGRLLVLRDAIKHGKKWLQSVGLTEVDIFC